MDKTALSIKLLRGFKHQPSQYKRANVPVIQHSTVKILCDFFNSYEIIFILFLENKAIDLFHLF